MLFRQVVGQASLKNTIIQLIAAGRLPHAINLQGTEGSGNLALALATAQYIVCTGKLAADSCGVCPSCIKMARLQHPDVHFSFPTIAINKIPPTSKDLIRQFREFVTENPYGNDGDWLDSLEKEKQGNITANECREIIQKLQLRSFESEYKILVMWYPEYLGNEGNILLKLIEEPPAKTILMFVSTSTDKLLLTIQSRTQLFVLKRLTDTEIRDALMERGIGEKIATQCARLAEGNYNEALKMAADHDDGSFDILRNWLNLLFSNNGLQLVAWVNQIADKKKDTQKKFIEYFMQLLEHSLRLTFAGNEPMLLVESEHKLIQTLLQKGLDGAKVMAITRLLNDTIYHIERNANSKILFHNVSLQIQQVLVEKKTAAKP